MNFFLDMLVYPQFFALSRRWSPFSPLLLSIRSLWYLVSFLEIQFETVTFFFLGTFCAINYSLATSQERVGALESFEEGRNRQ